MPKGKDRQLLVPMIVMATLAIVLTILAYFSRGNGVYLEGLKGAGLLLLQILPLFCFSLIVSNMVQVLIPRELIAKWIGNESGVRGIFIGAFVGGLTPGGPYVNLPIALTLQRAGADIGVMVAYLTGWSLYAVSRFPLEIGILGWRFTVMRFASILILPPISGFIARLLFHNVKF